MSLTQYNLSELSQKIKSQAVTAREVVSDYLKNQRLILRLKIIRCLFNFGFRASIKSSR